ncbi:MAG: hypothetical protein Q8M02_10560 [Candidatus Didemnitutus sp.]|nr:hypothetical protein [Candidatus Didemnitutus sp.]
MIIVTMKTPMFRYGLYRAHTVCAGSPAPSRRHQFHLSDLAFTQVDARRECAARNRRCPGSGWTWSKLVDPVA